MKVAIYPGSFDPATLGHMDVIERACQVFDRLIVAVLINRAKQPTFTTEERMDFLRRMVRDLPNVEVTSFDGLLADWAVAHRIDQSQQQAQETEGQIQQLLAFLHAQLEQAAEEAKRLRESLDQVAAASPFPQ